LHNALRYTNSTHIGPADRITLFASLSTGQGAPTTFCALLNGASVYPITLKEDGGIGLAHWLITEELTVYIAAATVFRHFVGTLTGKEHFPHLRLIRLGAEPVRKSDVELYKAHFAPHCILAIFLSATEVGNFAQYFLDQETVITERIVPVGYAADDMEILLLDEAGTALGSNHRGEIAVRSRYLSPGYWRMPEQTQAAFLPDPQGADQRIYRTRDLGQRRSDGGLEHLGRIDLQVKIRGFRLELQEIEAVLRTHPAIHEAVVEATQTEGGEHRLIAYVVPAQGQAPTSGALHAYVQKRLPEYMVPFAFIFLQALPLTPIGKVDRRALPGPDPARPAGAPAFVAPQNALERQLTAMWEQLLGIQPIGVQDNFFALGGNSLLALRLGAQIAQILGNTFPAALL